MSVDVARAYLQRGWAPIPVPLRQKAPTLTGWQRLRITDERALVAHFNGEPQNVGVLQGEPSGWLIDGDLDAAEALRLAHAFLPPTPSRFGRESRRASHWLYVTTTPLKTKKFRDPNTADDDETGMLVELRSTGAQTVFPGSVHPSGEPVSWDEDGAPAPIDGTTLAERAAHLAVACLLARYWPSRGARHDVALAAAGLFAHGGIAEDIATRIITMAARDAGEADHADDVRSTYQRYREGVAVTGGPSLADLLRGDGPQLVRRIREWLGLRSAAAVADGRDAGAPHSTDAGNAKRLARAFDGDVRYCYAWQAFLEWSSRHWARDPGAGIIARAKAVALALYAEAASEPDAARRAEVAAWARKSESEARLRAMVFLSQSEPGVPVAVDALDADPWVLNLENGALDLRESAVVFRPHRRADLLTKVAPVRYDPDAQCPRWLTFLGRIFEERATLITFVQRALGYSLTGDTGERCFFLCWGVGHNGKTTLLNAVRAVLGPDYAAATRAETFMVRSPDAIPNDLAKLRAVRFATAVETEENRRLAEALLKQATGNDPLPARFMRAEWFEFVPQFKLWLATNHKPVIRGTDPAIWGRVLLIPFTVTIPEGERDKTLGATLQAEAPGILNWLLAGYRAWRANGLRPPPAVRLATERYRAEMDTFGEFLRERCFTKDPQATITFRGLYDAYVAWCDATHERPRSRRAVAGLLTERGFAEHRVGNDKGRLGLRLRAPGDPPPSESDDDAEARVPDATEELVL